MFLKAFLQLMISGEEILQVTDGFAEYTCIRQIYDTEMIRSVPVEALAGHDQHLL